LIAGFSLVSGIIPVGSPLFFLPRACFIALHWPLPFPDSSHLLQHLHGVCEVELAGKDSGSSY
jgi:hypothetical protein